MENKTLKIEQMSKADEVIKRITKDNEVFTIKLLGSEKNKSNAFYILINTQQTISTEKNIFHLIEKSTLDLLDEAEIKYKILENEILPHPKG